MPTLECPICEKKVSYESFDDVPFRPFCSERCKLLDLGRWLNEEYRISEEPPEAHQDEGDKLDAAEKPPPEQ